MRAPGITTRGSASGRAYRPATGGDMDAVMDRATSRHMDLEVATSRKQGESEMRSLLLPRAHLHP